MIFNVIISNVGKWFNPNTKIFTASINGTYAFYVSALEYSDQYLVLEIVLNGVSKVRLIRYSSIGLPDRNKHDGAEPSQGRQSLGYASPWQGLIIILLLFQWTLLLGSWFNQFNCKVSVKKCVILFLLKIYSISFLIICVLHLAFKLLKKRKHLPIENKPHHTFIKDFPNHISYLTVESIYDHPCHTRSTYYSSCSLNLPKIIYFKLVLSLLNVNFTRTNEELINF